MICSLNASKHVGLHRIPTRYGDWTITVRVMPVAIHMHIHKLLIPLLFNAVYAQDGKENTGPEGEKELFAT